MEEIIYLDRQGQSMLLSFSWKPGNLKSAHIADGGDQGIRPLAGDVTFFSTSLQVMVDICQGIKSASKPLLRFQASTRPPLAPEDLELRRCVIVYGGNELATTRAIQTSKLPSGASFV